jgi:hypothetical protein
MIKNQIFKFVKTARRQSEFRNCGASHIRADRYRRRSPLRPDSNALIRRGRRPLSGIVTRQKSSGHLYQLSKRELLVPPNDFHLGLTVILLLVDRKTAPDKSHELLTGMCELFHKPD